MASTSSGIILMLLITAPGVKGFLRQTMNHADDQDLHESEVTFMPGPRLAPTRGPGPERIEMPLYSSSNRSMGLNKINVYWVDVWPAGK